MIGPIKAARITGVVLCVLLVVVAISVAVLSRSLLSIIFAASVVVLFTISFLRSRKLSEEEIIRRQDRLMGKPGIDDPKKLARWIP
jgi:cobalamin biosynthesis protein CobD/CbiB